MTPEAMAQVSVLGMASLHAFKSMILFCSVKRKSVRFLSAVGLSISLLIATASHFNGLLSGMNLTTSGLCAIVAAYMIKESLNMPDDQPQELLQLVASYVQFLLQDVPPPTKHRQPSQTTEPEAPIPDHQYQLRQYLQCLALASCQYLIYDVIMIWLARIPYSELILQPIAFRAVHSFVFGVALYLMFQVLVVPLVSLAWVIYPPGASKSVKSFNRPWLTTSPQDFWSNRWHQFFRNTLIHIAFTPVKNVFRALQGQPKAASVSPASPLSRLVFFLGKALPVFSCFLLSGLIHEYMCWASLGAATGHQLLFFVLHGILVVLEGVVITWAPKLGTRVPHWVKVSCMYTLLVATAPLFFEPWVRVDVQQSFWRPVQIAQPLLTQLGIAF